jgi:predicted NBD/HSP70 family sugar kinase
VRTVRSRRETRAAILGYLWCSRGDFRPNIAENVALTEASVSRIIAELKAERVVEETRRTAPYPGGPSIFITLSNDIAVAALEISNDRLHAAVGTLNGDILYSERHSLPDGLDADSVRAALSEAVGELAHWTRRRGVLIEQLSVSIPGYHPDRRGNPIVALDPAALGLRIAVDLPDVPLTLTNSITTRAVAHRLQIGLGHAGGPYFFVYVGHGVGAALVDEFAESGAVEPCELGHVVVLPHGQRCRCGHVGCLETYVSTVALADILNVEEQDLIAQGDGWVGAFRISQRTRTEIRARLLKLGHAIGNALNLGRRRRVIITGWPSVLPEDDRDVVRRGIDETLLGGAEGVEIEFSPANFGKEPTTGLALATFNFIQRAGERSPAALPERQDSAAETT